MKLLDAIADRLGFQPKNTTQSSWSSAVRGYSLWDEFGFSSAGLPIPNEQTAWTVSAIAACVNLISGAISSMPLHVMKRNRTGDSERSFDDPLWWVLNEEFCPRWSAAAAWEYILQSHLLHGDGFARIIRGPNGEARGLEPYHPLRVNPVVSQDGTRLIYSVDPDPLLSGGPPEAQTRLVLDQDDMIHISGSGFDGRRTPSPLSHMLRMSGSVAMATQEFSARFFANGARPDYALQTDATMGAEAVENIRAQIDERHKGLQNSHRPMLLHSGLKAQALQLPLEDLQLIATRQFQIEEIARAYGVPPFMIGHNEKTTSWGSGVEAMGTAFVRYTLSRHLEKIHCEFNRKLFRTYTRFVKFDTFELERADMQSMMTSFRTAVGMAGEPGFLTVNEVRQYLNKAPVPDGDQLNKGLQNAQQPPAA